MRKFALVFLSAAGICGPFAANAAIMKNTPPVITVSGASAVPSATTVPSDMPYQLAHINGAITRLAAAGAEHPAANGHAESGSFPLVPGLDRRLNFIPNGQKNMRGAGIIPRLACPTYVSRHQGPHRAGRKQQEFCMKKVFGARFCPHHRAVHRGLRSPAA